MSLKYESELLYDLMKRDGDDAPSDVLPYESELKEKYLNQVVGAYPKLQDYRPEWLNYNLYHHLPSDFPVETVTDVTHATFQNVVPYAYGKAVLKGQTLVNEALIDYMNTNNYATISGDTLTLDLSRQNSLIELTKENPLLVPNAIYTCILYDVVGDTTNVNFSIQNASSTKLHLKDVGYKFKFTMGIGNNTTKRLCYVENLVATSGTVSFKMVLLKGDYTNVDIPYFTGMQSVIMPVLTTTSKNLFDMNRPYDAITDSQATVVQGTNQITVSSAESGIYVNANFILDKDFFAGKTVTGSCLYESDEKDIGTVQIHYQDGNGEQHYQWIRTPRTFTFPNNFIGDVMLSVSANNTGTPQSNTVTVKNIQLELGSTPTPYEPYKSNILTVNEDVELGSVGEVKDELNLLTGQLTQRTETRAYQEGDESNSEVITDMANTRYKLPKESIKTVDLTCLNEQGESVNFMPFEGTMHVSTSSNTLPPLMDMNVPVEATTQNLNSFANMIKEE